VNSQLEPVKDILSNFLSDMKKQEGIWKSVEHDLTDSNNGSWQNEEAYCWIYADPEYYFLMGNEYSKSHPEVPAAKKKAKPYYHAWLHEDHYLQEILPYIIQQPDNEDTLASYLERTYANIHKQKGSRTLEWRSLKSFIEYLRCILPADQVEFIEVLFPEGMAMLNGYIIKNEKLSACPIDILLTVKILQELVKRVFEGRPNAQHSAAEALALCWMCLTSARRRLLTAFRMIYKAPLTSLSLQKDTDDIYGRTLHNSFALPTFYGRAQTFISEYLFEYLSALNLASQEKGKTILHCPQRILERSLYDIVQKIPEAQKLGKITFLTFMSLPHEIIGQRFKSIFLSHS
jgi:hypothetical protein